MADLELSLRHWPGEDQDNSPLSNLIPLINKQRGGFRLITEQSLLEEIEKAEVSDEDASGEDVVDAELGDEDEAASRAEEVANARNELLKGIAQAHNDAFMALDFVSLLVSSEIPRQAETSMSQHLQSVVPLGSLGFEKIEAKPVGRERRDDDRVLARGWKVEAFRSAAQSLEDMAQMMSSEATQESVYWKEVQEVRDAGWVMCRLPVDKRMLGVRFGFAEASASYRDRGIAALRRGDEGHISLDQGLLHTENKVVRLRILSGNDVIATSSNPYQSSEEESIRISILQARNNIFEEELYHELTREALILANFGVKTNSNDIRIPLPNNECLCLDLVGQSHFDNSESQNQLKANIIASAVRALLCYGHGSNLKKRSQIPAPISDQPPPPIYYPILRPIISYFSHQEADFALNELAQNLTSLAKKAGLTISYILDPCKNVIHMDPKDFSVGQIVDAFIRSPQSQVQFTLVSNCVLHIKVGTFLGPPLYGTDFAIRRVIGGVEESPKHTLRFRTLEEAKDCIFAFFEAAITDHIRCGDGQDGNEPVENENEGAWHRAFDQNELARRIKGRSYHVRVEVQERSLRLIHGVANTKPSVVDWSLDDSAEERSLREILDKIGV